MNELKRIQNKQKEMKKVKMDTVNLLKMVDELMTKKHG